ncbi:type II secretion system protein GspI [Sphingomonas gilva]|uniref:Type II secretion system protein I n=1 Tax=Sphingomonas gilva TaxID=2305907 RepID=A0A396RTI3_9SPHN|nr:type II secretion system minor pseudopilin GspI [Sphingomonas gilva]RHW16961.1 type II secretion system protein GspI [Sphingomonas gilva]
MSKANGFSHFGRSAEHGFTLVEMMVALAVFSLAALALMKLVGVSIASTGTVDRKLIAQIVAENVAVEALADPVAPPLGTTNGVEINGGLSWRWVRRTTRTADIRILRIDIAVAGANGPPAARLTVVRSVAG